METFVRNETIFIKKKKERQRGDKCEKKEEKK